MASHRLIGPEQAAALAYRRRWLVVAIVVSAEIMDLLDSTILGVAAPTIRADLHGTDTLVQWLTTGYTLPFATLLITGGRLGDLYPRRLLFAIGSAGFTLATIICAAANGPATLIGGRVAQGVFAAVLAPQGFGLMRSVFPEDEVRRAYAAFGPVLGLTSVGGPIIGGLLSETDVFGLGWRIVFLVTVPVGVFAAIGAVTLIPSSLETAAPVTRRGVDRSGTLLVLVGGLAIIYPIVEGQTLGWPWWGYLLMVYGVGCFVALVVRREPVGMPLIEPALLREPAFGRGVAIVFAFVAGFTGMLLLVSVFCQAALGFSAVRAGLTLVPLAVGIVFTSPVGAAMAEHQGRLAIRIGLVVSTLGAGLMALTVGLVGLSMSNWDILPALLITGLGIGMVFPPLVDVVLAGSNLEQTGSASGVLGAVQQLATAVGIAVLTSIYFDGHSPVAAFVVAGCCSAGCFAVAGGLTLLMRRSAASTSSDDLAVVEELPVSRDVELAVAG